MRRKPLIALAQATVAVALVAAAPAPRAAPAPAHRAAPAPAHAPTRGCTHFGRPAIAADPRPHALRVFAIQFEQQPASIRTGADYARAIDCAMRLEVVPYLAKGRPNLVVFDEDIGIEALGAGSRGTPARRLLRHGVPECRGMPFPCATLATLAALDTGYDKALRYLEPRFPALRNELSRAFVADTDGFVRVFMGTMAREAIKYHVYVVAANTQSPFRLTRDPKAIAALKDPTAKHVHAVYEPTAGVAYDTTFIWAPRILHRHAPQPTANLLAVNRKVPLTGLEQALGFAPGPARGTAATKNLAPIQIPGTKARLGFATSLPAFVYGQPARGHECDDVSVSYMRCLDRLGANVLIQADANPGEWTGPDGSDTAEHWQPLSWMTSSYRAVTDPSVRFKYAVNPFMVGNLADAPFDGQSAILERGLKSSRGCHYIGNARFVPGDDDPALSSYAGSKPEFLAMAPWVIAGGPRAQLRKVGDALAAGTGHRNYVQTAVIADLTFPLDKHRKGCLVAGR